MRRVVVTGIGAISVFGSDRDEALQRLRERKSAVRFMPSWLEYDGLNTALGAPVTDFEVPSHYTRKQLRSMGRVSQMSVAASEQALQMAGLLGDSVLKSGRTGVHSAHHPAARMRLPSSVTCCCTNLWTGLTQPVMCA